MIEYKIKELKDFYNNYDTNNNIKISQINNLEEALSIIIDYDYTHNNIYHIFPVVASIFIVSFVISNFITI